MKASDLLPSLQADRKTALDFGLKPNVTGKFGFSTQSGCPSCNGPLKFQANNGSKGNCKTCGRSEILISELKHKDEWTATATPSTECPTSHQIGDLSDVLPMGKDSDTPEIEAPKPASVEPPRRIEEPRFKFKPLSEIVKHHPGMRTWWLRDRIPAASVVLIHGAPATLKTTIAADIDCSIATGSPWRGIESKQGKILYVAAEDYYGARLRIEAWFERNQLQPDNIDILDIPIVLADESDVDLLIEIVNSMPVKPASITIDTLALSMGKYSENNDMQLFCNGATRIKSQTGTTVIIIHHPGHGDKSRSRGGSQLPANADVIYQVERKDDVCTMKCQKMKNGIEPADLSWAIETQKTKWVDEDGKPITSVVLTPVDNPEPEDRPKQPSRQQEIALTVLRLSLIHISEPTRPY